MVQAAHDLFARAPETALFLALAIGYAIGRVKLGRFQLGGVAGSLLAAVVISQVGITMGGPLKAVSFALFVYAVGYLSGPQFVNALDRRALREVGLAVFLWATTLALAVGLAWALKLDKGTAAGMLGGAMTQTGIIGTAGD